jgi:hypothetical protein
MATLWLDAVHCCFDCVEDCESNQVKLDSSASAVGSTGMKSGKHHVDGIVSIFGGHRSGGDALRRIVDCTCACKPKKSMRAVNVGLSTAAKVRRCRDEFDDCPAAVAMGSVVWWEMPNSASEGRGTVDTKPEDARVRNAYADVDSNK